ncbi:MAG: ATP-dependent helicase, partial [Nitrospinales bacterium]
PVAALYNEKFRYLLVDEFQDTNLAQYQLVRLLSRRHNNVCVVGDDDQSIYQWRGANLGNILNFERDFPGAEVIKLEENYRSTQNILKAAGAVVKQNSARKDKTLWTRNEKGAPLVYFRAEDAIDEAETVCDQVCKLAQSESCSLDDMAVLYRTNAQSRAMEDALNKKNIPHQVVGGLKFYERKEVKDIMAYMRVALNPADTVALMRIVNVPVRGIGKTSLEKIIAWSEENRLSLLEGLRLAGERRVVASAAAGKIAKFIALLDHLANVCQNKSAQEFLLDVYERTGYMDMLKKVDTKENRDRRANLEEFYAAVDQWAKQNENASLKDFLDSKTLASDIDEYGEARGVLRLMTLHTCKGLEFQMVFIIGMENGLLPHVSSMGSDDEYEEERRLCYVGFTRAKRRLFISNAKRRQIFGNTTSNFPSDFLQSIPADVLTQGTTLGNRFPVAAPSFSRGKTSGASPPARVQIPKGQNYSIGQKVLHPKFGAGVIIKREGSEDDLKVNVFFKGVGQKKLAVNLAKLIMV